ncbi:unnamed protein product [Phyllotreta striolata]|uniref:Uncharacterized protein n=1 Tax=Phyllotreta striolata TaxID=444603 RepID=A0A9N9TSP6_PHYSR|nr:unnamed protein product [Phyllotreta striolata]
MDKILIYLLAGLVASECKEPTKRDRRGHYDSTYSLGIGPVQIQNHPGASESLYSYQNSKAISLPEYSTEPLHLNYYELNSIEKPVQESQEYVPPQSVGSAVIPELPPPAVPVNAAAANVPGDGNSIFLGSGALGVLNLGGGAYVLGSGALGYSEIRRNPRPNIRASTLPPIQASPNLLPAAVNSPERPRQRAVFSYSFPTGHGSPVNQNEYEFLAPSQAGFGDPLPPGRLKITNTYAVPTALVLPARLADPARYQAPLREYKTVPTSLTVPQTQPPTQAQPITTQSVTVESDLLNIYPKRVNDLYQYFKK